MYHLTKIVVSEEKGENVITCNIQVFIIRYNTFINLLYFIPTYQNKVHILTLFDKLNSVS